MSVKIIIGDCRDKLRELESESVHCCVTSPPYFGLRDYGVEGQLGLESTIDEYLFEMVVGVFSEVRRVLRKDGTCWVNMGDCYVTSPPGNKPNSTKDSSTLPNSRENLEMRRSGYAKDRKFVLNDKDGAYSRRMNRQLGNDEDMDSIFGNRAARTGLKQKDLVGMPWRLAFALQADGWWLRQDIIWHKPSPMPESCTDRCTKAHEYIFLLSKRPRYYYDAGAIREDAIYGRRDDPDDIARSDRKAKSSGVWRNVGTATEAVERGRNQRNATYDKDAGRNKRSVWTVNAAPFAEAHFATFPPDLIEPCILAGCPPGGVVLDPFGGAGTTGLVADRLQRNAILIELNPSYAEMAERRICNDAPLFSDPELVS